MKIRFLYFGILLLGACYCKSMDDDGEEVDLKGEAKTQEAEIEQTQIKILPSGGTSKSTSQGSRINLEFIPGYSGSSGGATYIRYGKTVCPDTKGTQLIYKGRAAGGYYNHRGGGTEILCLPENPDFLASRNGGNRAFITQTEYETNTGPSFQNLHDYEVPCATCLSTARGAKIMIPGKINCMKGWTREYYGYLMTEYHNHPGRLQYVCMDVNAEGVSGTRRNRNGALLYHVEVHTGTLPSTYRNGNEITCVVCTI